MTASRSLSQRLAKPTLDRDRDVRDLVIRKQRERILLAMIELVADRGYWKTTIELIGKTARVALSTFYEHFSSKEECFLAAFDGSVELAEQVLGERLNPDELWPNQISAAVETCLEMIVAEPARGRLCIVESQGAGVAALARYQRLLACVAAKLRQGRDFGRGADHLPEGFESAIAGGLAWLVHQRLVTDRLEGIRALGPEMLQITLTPYLGELEAGRFADAAQEMSGSIHRGQGRAIEPVA